MYWYKSSSSKDSNDPTIQLTPKGLQLYLSLKKQPAKVKKVAQLDELPSWDMPSIPLIRPETIKDSPRAMQYVLTIGNLYEQNGTWPKQSEIVQIMGVSSPSVTQVINNLKSLGLIVIKPNKKAPVELTPKALPGLRGVDPYIIISNLVASGIVSWDMLKNYKQRIPNARNTFYDLFGLQEPQINVPPTRQPRYFPRRTSSLFNRKLAALTLAARPALPDIDPWSVIINLLKANIVSGAQIGYCMSLELESEQDISHAKASFLSNMQPEPTPIYTPQPQPPAPEATTASA